MYKLAGYFSMYTGLLISDGLSYFTLGETIYCMESLKGILSRWPYTSTKNTVQTQWTVWAPVSCIYENNILDINSGSVYRNC